MQSRANSKAIRRRDVSSVSLFPFLAVLICTLGVLILLLVIFTHQARLQAAREALEKNKSEAAENTRQNETSKERIELLRKSREEAARRLAEIRLRLGIIEDHSRKLTENLNQLKETKEQLEQSRADGRRHEQIEAELADTKANIARVEADIETMRSETARLSNSHRPTIPYEGSSGTLRIPICIECRGDSIVLQPEGIVLTEKDFDGPLGPENPLAAALRAAREHIMTTAGKNITDAEIKRIEPYPLLLVRPAGTLSYNCARQALESWGPDFGYELIETEWKIDYPSSDAALAQAMQQAVDSARALQMRLAAAAPKHYPQSIIDGPAPAKNYSTSGRGGVTAFRGELRQSGYRTPGERLAEQRAGGGDYSAAGSGGGNNGGLPAGNGTGTGGGSGGVGGSGTGNIAAAGTPDGKYAASGNGTANASSDSMLSSGAAGNSSGDSLLGGSGGNVNASSSNASAGTNGTAGGGASGNPSTAGQGGSGNISFGQENVGQQPANATPPEGQIAEPLRPGEWRPSDPRHRPTKLDKPGPDDDKQSRHKPAPGLADKRGKNWGLPDSASRSTPLPRPINVQCHADRLVVVPEQGLGGRQEVTLDGPTVDSVDEFVSAVRLYMDKSWGMAGNRMYWKPILKVDVAPGGEARFEDLKTLLDDSGLEVVKRETNQLR